MLIGPFLEKNFIAASSDYLTSDVVLLGLPYDCTCTNRAGARFAPLQIRVESVGIETYSPYFDFDIADLSFFDAGDLEFPFGNAAKMLDIVEENTKCIYDDGKKILGIGGEHLVTLGEIRALAKKYKNLAVIQFDAHTDLRSAYLGEKLTHSGVMFQIAEIIGYENIAQIGIRSGEKAEFQIMREKNTQKFSFDELSVKPAPRHFASSSFLSSTSTAITFAPRNEARITAPKPIIPQPITITVSISVTLARSTA
ncbi:MAG: agmatinase [Candidatus Gastranaerophilales bacterium]|nr:agmatinase [Candidatus Gastranaerophilales bacterium]